MSFSFRYWLFNRLPLRYKVEDTYKDIYDRGLLERYLEIFGLELDNELTPKIDNYLQIINPFEADDKFLTSISYTLGSPPDLLGDPDKYAKLLAYMIAIYKIKGTAKAYELLFSLLGYSINIVELAPTVAAQFDIGEILDEDTPWQMDMGCPSCSDYEVIIYTLLSSGGGCIAPLNNSIDNTILPTFIAIIQFNEPINAHLAGIINGAKICDQVSYCLENTITIQTERITSLDNGFLLDDGKIFDDNLIVYSSATVFDCDTAPSGGSFNDDFNNDFDM